MKRHNFYTFLQKNTENLNSHELLDIWRNKAERQSLFQDKVIELAQKGSGWSLATQSCGAGAAGLLHQQAIGKILAIATALSLGTYLLTDRLVNSRGTSSVLWRMQFKDPGYGIPRKDKPWDYDLALSSLNPEGRGSILTSFRANREVSRRLGKPVGVIARAKAALKPQRPADKADDVQQNKPKP